MHRHHMAPVVASRAVMSQGESTPRRIVVAAVATAALLVATGCGGGASQNADESSGDFKLAVTHTSFPRAQGLAETSTLRITVHNSGTTTIPDVAMTVDGISAQSATADNADRERPVWVLNQGPPGGVTAYVNTWQLGPLAGGRSRTFTWSLTATTAGTHTLRYRAAAGLDGKAHAVAAAGGSLDGSIVVHVTRKPRTTVVDPVTGDIVPAVTAAPAIP